MTDKKWLTYGTDISTTKNYKLNVFRIREIAFNIYALERKLKSLNLHFFTENYNIK